jgi:hypothetical protein
LGGTTKNVTLSFSWTHGILKNHKKCLKKDFHYDVLVSTLIGHVDFQNMILIYKNIIAHPIFIKMKPSPFLYSKEHFFLNEVYQIMCFEKSKVDSKYINVSSH